LGCQFCDKKSVMNDLCRTHFIEAFEKKVYDCIDDYDLIPKDANLLVGCSGGKDSLTVLYLLKKRGYKVTAYCVDEGIEGYRDETIVDAREFCEEHNINLIVESVEDEFGTRLDSAIKIKKSNPCSICGVFRRYLLNKHRDYDFMVTGHNMDDEIQNILMNLMKNQMELLARLGPKPGVHTSKSFLQRIKPLYFCSEKEVMAYSFLKGFKTSFVECPFAKTSFRAHIRDEINEYEAKNKGTKTSIVSYYLGLLPVLRDKLGGGKEEIQINTCSRCGEPSTREICHACSLKTEFKPLAP
jgi:tRNA-5-methyluridine54 2-sulfurtransferase